MSQTQVLVAGAGPTGLVLALWLARQGVQVRIIDKADAPGTTSRALAVQARTLELYRQLDLAETIVSRGHVVPGVNLWTEGEPRARLDFREVGEGLSPYPYLHIFPQDEHERLLIERLQAMGVTVERPVELTGFEQDAGGVRARLRGPAGESLCEAAYLAGCDGARSITRDVLGAGFPGGTYQHLFYVADVVAAGPPMNGELHVDLDEADFLAVFPLAGQGRARLIGTVSDKRAEDPESVRFEDVSRRAMDHLRVEVERVNWFSTYRVHHRVTDRFRSGRAFLLGDAAHIHSPAGGQGMNTGIGDAINLAWKLAAVLAGRADETLLGSYEVERRAFARRLVASTDRGFTLATAEGPVADLLRTRVVPAIAPRLLSLERIRELMFRTVSQITLNYRDMPLSAGAAGRVRGGDRLPWVATNGFDNFAPLPDIAWQAHVYGAAPAELSDWCARNGVPLCEIAWTEAHGHAGLARDALYLLRPDTYVALASPTASAAACADYFAERRLRPC
jgi:2-polyprenyl-6-methoxyphenol hydroxylase-like FAD-dependent oxidoreductase